MLRPVLIRQLDPVLSVIDTLRRFQDCPFLLLLDSAGQIRDRDARYTILTADPVDTVRLDTAAYGVAPFEQLRTWQRSIPACDGGHPPFCGGIAGFMSYELGGAFESVPMPDQRQFQTPVLLAGLFDWAIVWDHIDRTVSLYVIQLSELPADCGRSPHRERDAWVWDRLNRQQSETTVSSGLLVEKNLAGRTVTNQFDGQHPIPHVPGVFSDFTRDGYIAAVERVIEYIRAGDIFQANLAQHLTAAWSGSPVELYERVRTHNPAPFCGLLQSDDFAVVSASPERFLRVSQGNKVQTRPIKGTRRRQRSPIADLFSSDELSASEKDRAENIMIVDLLRNDISRVCQVGSVKVTGLCEIEVFETVQHLVSTVEGVLRPDRDVWDLCAASIPGGSITGAPKIRAMQIIAELEPVVRGAYCGNLFYLGPGGDFDSSILIRSFTLRNGHVQFPVGGGIVADSDPREEYEETLHKAAGMFRTLLLR